jgi:hypothetical protein
MLVFATYIYTFVMENVETFGLFIGRTLICNEFAPTILVWSLYTIGFRPVARYTENYIPRYNAITFVLCSVIINVLLRLLLLLYTDDQQLF